jgi:uncharacterized membrane protein
MGCSKLAALALVGALLGVCSAQYDTTFANFHKCNFVK